MISKYNDKGSEIAEANIKSKKVYEEKKISHFDHMKYYHLWRNYDLMTAIMGNLSLVIYFIYHEFESKNNAGTRDPKKWPDPMDDPEHKGNTNFVRSIVAGLSAVSVYCLI